MEISIPHVLTLTRADTYSGYNWDDGNQYKSCRGGRVVHKEPSQATESHTRCPRYNQSNPQQYSKRSGQRNHFGKPVEKPPLAFSSIFQIADISGPLGHVRKNANGWQMVKENRVGGRVGVSRVDPWSKSNVYGSLDSDTHAQHTGHINTSQKCKGHGYTRNNLFGKAS